MKRFLLLIVVMSFLYSCEYLNGPTTINKEITAEYLLQGNLDIYLTSNQVFRHKGKPGIENIKIGNDNLSDFQDCFKMYVASGTTPATTVSSAIIKLDGLDVLNASDFSKNTGQHTFEICNLTPTSVLTVEVRGEPGSFIDIWIEGKLKISNIGLVAYYPFNGNANDESGKEHNGTVEGGARLTTDRHGNINSAYEFDGNSNITTTYEGILGSQPRTVSIWAKTNISTRNMPLVGWGWNADYRQGGAFWCNFNGFIEGVHVDVQGGLITYDAKVGDNNWHHYAWVVPSISNPLLKDVKIYQDGNLLTTPIFYWNGKEFSENAPINTVAELPVQIGLYYEGSLDNLRIYNRALTEEEIIALALE
jgi:hypothetical protein